MAAHHERSAVASSRRREAVRTHSDASDIQRWLEQAGRWFRLVGQDRSRSARNIALRRAVETRSFPKLPNLPAAVQRPTTRLLTMVVLLMPLIWSAEAWWTPGSGVSWQWQMTGDLELFLEVDMYNIDLFDTSIAEIGVLRDRGVTVICSFSAGTFEEDRSDADAFESSWLGEEVDGGSDGERWLNVTHEGVLSAMEGRMDLAVNKSCDGIEPSNVEMYSQAGTGLNITAADQLDYNAWLAEQAHGRNLSVGLRNDWLQLDDLEPYFDWALSEDCLYQGECEVYRTNFIAAGKATLDTEYLQYDLAFCDNVTAMGFDVIIKDSSLDARRCSCQNPSTHVECDSLLEQSLADAPGESSPWVIATAVGGSVFVLVAAAIISMWRRRKGAANGSGGAAAGMGGGSSSGRFGSVRDVARR